MNIPLVADLTQSISSDYGVLKEGEGIAYRFVSYEYFCLQFTIAAVDGSNSVLDKMHLYCKVCIVK